jgi:hypothetical protein
LSCCGPRQSRCLLRSGCASTPCITDRALRPTLRLVSADKRWINAAFLTCSLRSGRSEVCPADIGRAARSHHQTRSGHRIAARGVAILHKSMTDKGCHCEEGAPAQLFPWNTVFGARRGNLRQVGPLRGFGITTLQPEGDCRVARGGGTGSVERFSAGSSQ